MCIFSYFQLKGGGIKTPEPDWSRNREGRSAAASRQNSPPRTEQSVSPVPRARRGSRLPRQHSYDDEVKNNLVPATQAESALILPPQMPRRASAYDVFSMPASVMPNSGLNRRASMRVSATTEPNTKATPETPVTSLVALEDDRRTRRRGSQL